MCIHSEGDNDIAAHWLINGKMESGSQNNHLGSLPCTLTAATIYTSLPRMAISRVYCAEIWISLYFSSQIYTIHQPEKQHAVIESPLITAQALAPITSVLSHVSPPAQHWNIYHSCPFPSTPHISYSTLSFFTAAIPWSGQPSTDYLFWLVLLSLVLLSDCEALAASTLPLSG